MHPFADNRLQIAPEKLKYGHVLAKILLFYTRSHNDWCGFSIIAFVQRVLSRIETGARAGVGKSTCCIGKAGRLEDIPVYCEADICHSMRCSQARHETRTYHTEPHRHR